MTHGLPLIFFPPYADCPSQQNMVVVVPPAEVSSGGYFHIWYILPNRECFIFSVGLKILTLSGSLAKHKRGTYCI
jgi:hypothetical protein